MSVEQILRNDLEEKIERKAVEFKICNSHSNLMARDFRRMQFAENWSLLSLVLYIFVLDQIKTSVRQQNKEILWSGVSKIWISLTRFASWSDAKEHVGEGKREQGRSFAI